MTHILQVGSTARSQYIHRLGRTARAGKEGSGTLLLFDYEETAMVKELKDMPLVKKEFREIELQTQRTQVTSVLTKIQDGEYPAIETLGASTYAAYFGFYTNGWIQKFNIDKQALVGKAYDLSRALGLTSTPALTKKAVGMLGLKGLQGLVVEDVAALKQRKEKKQNQHSNNTTSHSHTHTKKNTHKNTKHKHKHKQGKQIRQAWGEDGN